MIDDGPALLWRWNGRRSDGISPAPLPGLRPLPAIIGQALLHGCLKISLEFVQVDEAVLVGIPFIALGPEGLRHFVVVEQTVAVEIQAPVHAFGPAVRGPASL